MLLGCGKLVLPEGSLALRLMTRAARINAHGLGSLVIDSPVPKEGHLQTNRLFNYT